MCGNVEGNIRIWEVESWQILLNLRASPSSAVFLNDSTKLVFGSAWGGIQVWDTHSWQRLYTLKGHLGFVQSVAISKDNMQLASSCSDGTVKIWNIHSPSQDFDNHTQVLDFSGFDFSPDGTVFASGGLNGIIKIWDAHTGNCLRTIEGRCNSIVVLAFSPNGDFLVSFDFSLRIFEVWESHTWQCVNTVEYVGEAARQMAFSPDGTLLISSHRDGSYRVWNTQTWKCLKVLTLAKNGWETWNIFSMLFSSDSTLFASIVTEGLAPIIKIWNTRNWRCLETIEGQYEPIYSLSYSPDKAQFTLGPSKFSKSTIDICDIHSGQCVQSLEGYGNHIVRSDFTQSSIQTNRGIFTLPSFSLDPEYTSTSIEPTHGRGFGVSDDRSWITWNSAKLLKLPSGYGLSDFTMSKDGTSIGIGCRSGHVILLHANRE